MASANMTGNPGPQQRPAASDNGPSASPLLKEGGSKMVESRPTPTSNSDVTKGFAQASATSLLSEAGLTTSRETKSEPLDDTNVSTNELGRTGGFPDHTQRPRTSGAQGTAIGGNGAKPRSPFGMKAMGGVVPRPGQVTKMPSGRRK